MATPVMDISLLEGFSVIFIMLFVAVVVYAILQSTKSFGSNKGIHVLIAIIIAIMTLFVPKITEVIKLIAPWFVLLFIFIMFVLIAFKMLGVTDEGIAGVLKKRIDVTYWIIVLSVIILLGGIGKVFFTGVPGQPSNGDGAINASGGGPIGETGEGAFWATLFHPKVLGMVFVLLIAVFTMMLITQKERVT